MRLLVTGASGLLGLTLACQAAGEHEVFGVVHKHLLDGAPFKTLSADLTLPGVAEQVLESTQPEVVVHCAAMATPDACEMDPQRAWIINAEVPGRMASLAQQSRVKFLHISTDSVFDGRRGGYSETDEPNPLNVYAQTKLAGEHRVKAANPQAVIARVIFYGWSLSGERSLAEWFFNNLSAGRRVKGFTDALFCPLLVNHLAELLLEMAQRDLSGLYHVASSETLSKFDFGMAIARRFALDPDLITPASVMDVGLPARRAANLSLRVDKLSEALNKSLPDQSAGLDRFYQLYQDGYAEAVNKLGEINQTREKLE